MDRDAPGTGDTRWNQRRGRWEAWSGRAWAPALYSVHPEELLSPTPLGERDSLPVGRREELLRKVITREALNGATLVHQDDVLAVFAAKRPVSHGWHALLTLLSGGLWAPVWLVLSVARQEDRYQVVVDPYGHVWGREAARR